MSTENELEQFVAEEIVKLENQINEIANHVFGSLNDEQMAMELSKHLAFNYLEHTNSEDSGFIGKYKDKISKQNIAISANYLKNAKHYVVGEDFFEAICHIIRANFFIGAAAEYVWAKYDLSNMNARKNEERVKKYDTRDKLLESDWLKNTKRNLQATKAADEMMLRDAYKNAEPQPTKRALIDLIKIWKSKNYTLPSKV